MAKCKNNAYAPTFVGDTKYFILLIYFFVGSKGVKRKITQVENI